MTKLIEPEVRDFYTKLHDEETKYGASAVRRAGMDIVRSLMKRRQLQTVLDYGAGKQELERYINEQLPKLEVTSYDPAVKKIDTIPEAKYDSIVSSDVMEHVEPDLIDDVLKDIFGRARRTVCLFIACFETGHLMPDNRDLHLIVRPPEWWRDKIAEVAPGWHLSEYRDVAHWQKKYYRHGTYLCYDFYTPSDQW